MLSSILARALPSPPTLTTKQLRLIQVPVKSVVKPAGTVYREKKQRNIYKRSMVKVNHKYVIYVTKLLQPEENLRITLCPI